MTILTGGASIRLSTLERELGKPSMAYLAGPMRGIEDFNCPAFNAAAERLRSGGWWILNPAETDATVKDQAEKSDNPLAVYMEQDLADVCSADVIFCLDGWEGSEGASLEVDVARRLGKRLYTFPDVQPLSPVVSRILDYVKPSGEPVVKEVDGVRADAREIREPFPSFDLCVCGPKTRAEGHCSCEPEPSCETILQEADRLVSSDRGSQYGHPALDFGKVTRMAKALWGRGPETPAEHALYMILLKVARLEATPGHRDSIVDIAGYAKTYEMVMRYESDVTL